MTGNAHARRTTAGVLSPRVPDSRDLEVRSAIFAPLSIELVLWLAWVWIALRRGRSYQESVTAVRGVLTHLSVDAIAAADGNRGRCDAHDTRPPPNPSPVCACWLP